MTVADHQAQLAKGAPMSEATEGFPVTFETLTVLEEGGVLFAEIAALPMNLLGPELVRDLCR